MKKIVCHGDRLTEASDLDKDEGLKHDSSIHCDELISLPKDRLTDYVGNLTSEKLCLLEKALKIALQLNDE